MRQARRKVVELINGVTQRGSIRGCPYVVGAAVLWASSATAGKALFATGITPFELVQVRVTVSSLILAVMLGLNSRELFRIRGADLGYFLLLGGAAMSLVQLGYFYAISKIQVAAAIFLEYLSPIMVGFFSVCFWKERLTVAKVVSLVVSIVGCYLVVGGYNLEMLQMNRMGILAALLSALCFAAYTLLAERSMQRYSPWTVLFYAFLFSTISWHIFYRPFQYLRADHTLEQWGWMLYVSVLGTVIPFGLFFAGVNLIRSTRASITATLEPICASLIAYIFLGENLSPLQVMGGGLVVGAIVLLQLQREQDELVPAMIRARSYRSNEKRGRCYYD
ncbi:MAG: EamA family transporter [Pseudomonadota bacterium]